LKAYTGVSTENKNKVIGTFINNIAEFSLPLVKPKKNDVGLPDSVYKNNLYYLKYQ
jgi:hypothetical protein